MKIRNFEEHSAAMKIKKTPAVRKSATRARRAEDAPRAPVIDYPCEGDTIYSGHYAVRVSMDGADAVELALDGGEWQPCRSAAGYYWFDWQTEIPGPHRLMARSRTGKGRWRNSDSRSCLVAAPTAG